MSDQNDFKKYKYEEMSNKVTHVDRRFLNETGSHNNEISSVPETIKGRISYRDIGSKVSRESISEKERTQIQRGDLELSESSSFFLSSDVNEGRRLVQTTDFESLSYYPRTEQTRESYMKILTWTSKYFDSDISEDILRSGVDLMLEILHTDLDGKKNRCEEILDRPISKDDFYELSKLSEQLTDYSKETEENEINNNGGVAIELDDNDGNFKENYNNELKIATDENGQQYDNLSDSDATQLKESSSYFTDGFVEAQIIKPERNLANNDLLIPEFHKIDQFWLRNQVAKLYPSAQSHEHTTMTQSLIGLMKRFMQENISSRSFVSELLQLLGQSNLKFVHEMVQNSPYIYYSMQLNNASEEDVPKILNEVSNRKLEFLVAQYNEYTQKFYSPASKKRRLESLPEKLTTDFTQREPRLIDLQTLVFDQGSHLMTTNKVNLPNGSFKRVKKSYEEFHIPAPEPPTMGSDERLVSISELPNWAQQAFPNSETLTLNRIQSKVYPIAFKEDENILLCAPTGSGKTNVALLTILRTISKFRNQDTGTLALNKFKIVYIAPLKALVQEQVREFQRRFDSFGIKVGELTGDSNLTKHQIKSTQILVTTPEKWDIITRKMSDISYVRLVRLLIIDEIHLLHDERGPVIESIVSRSIRNDEISGNEPVRLVGLSATLPNFNDVATFLRVDESKGLFYFDGSYRPCPLAQQFVGILEKKALKRYQAMNQACLDKVIDNLQGDHQIIVFVHSRVDTAKTARYLMENLSACNKLDLLQKTDLGSKEILREESKSFSSEDLRNLVVSGIGIHHAGLNKQDRSLVEDLFADGYVQVLVSTATLAWGVNLPAHTVIIKGTSVYSPEKGVWSQLAPQDILQMLGRAGRPRYDKTGEGIIITVQEEVQYYLAILNQQLPIESQLMSKIHDCLNSEIVLGTVTSRQEAVSWFSYSYLFVRMLRSPALYHVGPEYSQDKTLLEMRLDICHSALTQLQKNGLISFDPLSGKVWPNYLGRISSYFYIDHSTISLFNKFLKPYSTDIDLLRIFSQSSEFRFIPVRLDEKLELKRILQSIPIPVKDTAENPLTKVNILLQCYISHLKLEGFAIVQDMIYITQSASRILRAIHEIALKKRWATVSKYSLELYKMVNKRMWLSSSPFRQFPNVHPEIIRKSESSVLPWSYYLGLTESSEMAQAIRSEKLGLATLKLVKQFPKLTMNANFQPITHSLMRIEVVIYPEWEWNVSLHGFAESFLLLVEDCNGERILFCDTIVIKKQYIKEEHIVEFTVPILEPSEPNYFITLVSENWLQCEYKIPLMLTHLKRPKKYRPPTPLEEVPLIPVHNLNLPECRTVFDFEFFNKFQTRVFNSVFETDASALICANKGCGKTVIAELALLRLWCSGNGRAIYVSPCDATIAKIYKIWRRKFKSVAGGKVIKVLTGELNSDLKLLSISDVILATPAHLDQLCRRWKNRSVVQSIELVVADDCHTVGNGYNGFIYEVALSRIRIMAIQLSKPIRIVGLSNPLARADDFGSWLGVEIDHNYNFDSKERIAPLEIEIKSSDIKENHSMILAMLKIGFQAISDKFGSSVVFLPDTELCFEVGQELLTLFRKRNYNGSSQKFQPPVDSKHLAGIRDVRLKHLISQGIGILYQGIAGNDQNTIENLYELGCLKVIICSRDVVSLAPPCDFACVMGTQFYEGREHRYIDYSISDILEMVGVSSLQALIVTNSGKLDYYTKFLSEPLPVESHLSLFLTDAFVNEISCQVVRNRQDCIDWLTYTFFYRRLQLNPSYYGVTDVSSVGLSEYLSELVETTVNELTESQMIEFQEVDDDEIKDVVEIVPLTATMIASYYNVCFSTMQTFILSLSPKTKLKGMLEIVASAAEFDSIPVRKHEEGILNRLYDQVPIKCSTGASIESPRVKALILIQAHFSRTKLTPELHYDQQFVLRKMLNLVYTCVDILSGEGHLNAITAMDLSQMVVQGIWKNESPLKQIPFFDNAALLRRCQEARVETIFDIMSMEDDERDNLLKLSNAQLQKVAEFVNKFPNVDIDYELDITEGTIIVDEEREIIVTLTRDEQPEDLTVISSVYPYTKTENWWLVIGCSHSKELYGIKRTRISKQQEQVKVTFSVPSPGSHEITLWCMCDSYMDADKEVSFELRVEDNQIRI
ncbi:RNA-dependent ATPase RNA helicase [Komagataella phaffii CBS 7435]|uniref:RNA-dependent ATPase RNA helicase (DEIH box) n=2 Tax=Komagataella phaffii TaxID=460519 RepID=C4QXA9_KOMPG|nr:RNA-dependent ATPase RNA helicase (DEIH box) [Komagataella phaffii GS115]AOA60847.1 GQ67_02135T0 [Komagataella phaffii]CAH2446692.1 RNA-dependent ATPase RNA helicase [Komagataella phaffii CBS 7435]AOA66029.1 GQ68_02150T0 [Komagataella phaffii GS115]CAY67882.1 RNA-dependent ATPase RNA helicase (DEIH box) [Komagataella phaffii GS115]CCA36964.1 RNA-dependent ATPase RNA helicase [Komagataella phaffii CBS 7435]